MSRFSNFILNYCYCYMIVTDVISVLNCASVFLLRHLKGNKYVAFAIYDCFYFEQGKNTAGT